MIYRRTDDVLWKALLENVFDDFLRFFFSNADEVFDLSKDFTFLDKELADLFPYAEGQAPKHVDKLVKVFTKTGEAKCILVHIEVQGQKDKDFGFRMFTYYYRILDKYRIPVTAIALLTDPVKAFHPSGYEVSFMGTGNSFYFNSYKVLQQDEEKLEKNSNPFAIAILTTLLALKSRKLNDDKLFELKFRLLRNLYRRNIPQKKIDGLLLFLQLYVNFEKPHYNLKFEKVIDELNNSRKTMGIREFVLDRAKNEGLQKGIEKGIEQGVANKNLEFTTSLIRETSFDDEKIAHLVGVSPEFVKNVRADIGY